METNEIEKVLTVIQGIGSRDADLAPRYMSSAKYIEHNPCSENGIDGLKRYIRHLPGANHHLKVLRIFQDGPYVFTQEVRDGVAAFMHDVEAARRHRTIDEIKLLFGQGDFVFVAAKGSLEGDPCVYVDLYRVAGEKIAEHWGIIEKIEDSKNPNGLI